MNPDLTIIIPCYNSALFIKETFHKLEKFMAENNDIKVTYVDDSSQDATPNILESLIKNSALNQRMKLICHQSNYGKGGAICTGLNETETEIVCYTDADLAYHINNITEFKKTLSRGKIVIANRIHVDSLYLIPPKFLHYIFTRHLSSRVFNILTRLLLIAEVDDIQAGLKMAYTDDMKRWASLTTQKRFSFDSELLVIANLDKAKIINAPVRFKYDKERTTINFVRDSISMFMDLLRIKYKMLKGHYNQ